MAAGSLSNQRRDHRISSENLAERVMAMYLREIAYHRLLTAEEEVLLAQRVDAGKRAANELAVNGGRLPDDHRGELEHQISQGHAARRRLIECNLRLVVAIAGLYRHRGVAFMDLVQEGNLGLYRGIEKYD